MYEEKRTKSSPGGPGRIQRLTAACTRECHLGLIFVPLSPRGLSGDTPEWDCCSRYTITMRMSSGNQEAIRKRTTPPSERERRHGRLHLGYPTHRTTDTPLYNLARSLNGNPYVTHQLPDTSCPQIPQS